MGQFFQIHPENPQARLIKQAAQIVSAGGIVALPTDSAYALVCRLDDKNAVEKLRRIRGVDDKHHLTLLVRDLSEVAQYARVDNTQYRLLKATMPGPYTVILEATRELPRRLSHPSRKTIGLRVPENRITLALLEELGEPLIGTTLQLPGDEHMLSDPDEVRERLEKQIELIIDGGAGMLEATTVIDLTGPEPVLIREGRGDPAAFGL
ncbi:L-threonylcarbamoyladenylate synthase [Massilia aurea]|jgi:tRNA threonylcarbamoyl adenosine modification protein (Sua5/YciO/YrdC/YwlC family)|uniref:tRNA threonylcarbamoyl adenosine modification protein (Sua5/YciO/YrdC/YwlC family) n=1 Tax=Massilia aurea TaxID=373040 RepID=A0A7W9X1T5_9BURK|nr:L-threonylcarbamoyladenylate synthase [Massilia aurea]MBD8541625.1 threonylcarbamoyl-AMP synthase [Oxalobacteraceae sp. CFBP 8761]MBD8566242.1 threonylcarbamoyl-AMP synthase [Oxalobacteraceae sp. CFBP 8763]MBD8626226.1 threonylcarbamoyl-AMP synthase [Oxalobacteraceae sp. CFBP 8753]MBD8630666.1 threonylcarbamoyl-AMP synthase [Oxalobacteraceae sp. CFBP 8755]MBD8656658.1 threonylcarbamoyl-AMP synthase [Oxalobacteraceae sp. CFBP 13730]MBD8724002.1 threonylcarbamoyl-AMP synthase [Oxalobacterace